MNTLELCRFLEMLRIKHGISSEDFVADIVSLRQYQRYKKGIGNISQDKLDKFADKFGLDGSKLLSKFEKEKADQVNKINELYNAIANKNERLIEDAQKQIDRNFILTEHAQKYFDYTIIFKDYLNKKISKSEAIDMASKLVNYPEIYNQEYFHDIDILILSFLLSLISSRDQDILLAKLYSLYLQEDKILVNETKYINPLIISRIAKVYGMKREYEKVIFFCELGMKIGTKYQQYYLWDYFTYYKALAHYRLREYDEYRKELLKCFYVLQIDNNPDKITKFTNLIEKDFNINFTDTILEIMKTELK